jgi:hypothetical protein
MFGRRCPTRERIARGIIEHIEAQINLFERVVP